MYYRARPVRALTALATLAFLAGCAAGSAPPPVQVEPSTLLARVRPDAQHYGEDWMYSSQPGGNNATVYHRKGTSLKYVETLSVGLSSPQGAVATRSGWWYVANTGDSNVLVYRSTKTGPVSAGPSLNDSGELPVDVSVTPDRKLIAVSNASSTSSGTGSVSVYLNRANEPSRTLTYGSDLLVGQGVAIDSQGNCYWSFDDLSDLSVPGSIVKFNQCNGAGTLVTSGLKSAGAMVFDQDGNLYYIDEADGIFKCSKTSKCKLFVSGFGLAAAMNFDANDEHLWVADATGYLDAVDPQTGYIESQTISIDGDPYGIAPSPGS